jgi:hypothetical protein
VMEMVCSYKYQCSDNFFRPISWVVFGILGRNSAKMKQRR